MFWYEKPPHSVCGGELLNVAKQKLLSCIGWYRNRTLLS